MEHSVSLKDNYAFHRVYKKGKSAVSPCLVLYARRNGGAVSRLGVTVKKKSLGKAVVRNRVRRRFREIYRLNEKALAPGWDIIVVARSKSAEADYSALNSEFMRLAGKLGLTV